MARLLCTDVLCWLALELLFALIYLFLSLPKRAARLMRGAWATVALGGASSAVKLQRVRAWMQRKASWKRGARQQAEEPGVTLADTAAHPLALKVRGQDHSSSTTTAPQLAARIASGQLNNSR